MATGYGYVRDKEPLSVNWAEISKGFNERLAADEEERQKKRDDIQKQYDELTKELINKPVGYDTNLNRVISEYSALVSGSALESLNKLKRGQISEREYYNRRANRKSSTENFFLYANNFNSQMDGNMKLIQSQDPNNRGSERMAFLMALGQDMLDFKNTKAMIDPATDEMILVKTDEEGNPTNEIINVAQLGYLTAQQELQYNYKREIKEAIEGRGVKQYVKDGTTITTIQGAKIDPETATATVDAVGESILGSERDTISILAQNGYDFTQDESLKGKEGYIYYDIINNEWDYSVDAARDIIKNEIQNSISVEVKPDVIKSYQKATLERTDRAYNEGVRQFNETIKFKHDELLAANNLTATYINSPTNLIRTTDGLDTTANNYIRTIKENSFDTPQDQRDVAINLGEVFKTIDIDNATITFDDTEGEIISPASTPPGPYQTTGTAAVVSSPTLIIDIPNITEGPIQIPVNDKTQEYLENIMNSIGNAKKTNTTVKGSDFPFIVDNEFYNPDVAQEEVVVEDVTGGVDKIKNVINKTQNNNID
jgi:hypothetical protein